MKKVLLFLSFMVMFIHMASAGKIVVATSDYISGNTAVYDTKTGSFNPSALGQGDQDVAVDTDGEYVYFLSRGQGAVSKYVAADITGDSDAASPVWQYSVGPQSNPYDIVFLESKAYVLRYGAGEILIIDQNAADQESFELGTIDLSMFDDNDEVPQMAYGFVEDGMVYVVLQRLNGWTAEVPGLLVKIDPSTNAVVDLDPATDGVQGRELLVMNPQGFSQVGSVAYICGHALGVQTEGVQMIDLADPDLAQSMLLDEETLTMDISGVTVFDSANGVFFSSTYVPKDDKYILVGTAYWFDPQTGEVGDALPVPTPAGGAVKVGDVVYVCSVDDAVSGIYPVDPETNTLAGDPLLSSLPPTSIVHVSDDGPMNVAEEDAVPESFALDAPYPNPFNPATTLSFTLADDGLTTVSVFNVAGQRVETLVSERLSAGTHSVVWHAGDVSNGVYFLRVEHAQSVRTVKALLVK